MKIKPITINDFYHGAASAMQQSVESLLPPGINNEIGHFNVFSFEDLVHKFKVDPGYVPYNHRAFYKISLIRGKSIAEYADTVIQIEKNALLFATPKIPYNWTPQALSQKGYFCIFTDQFLLASNSGIVLDKLPLFHPAGYPVFHLTDNESKKLVFIYKKMQDAITSNYIYKYDLIRNFVMELIHFGQRLQPLTTYGTHNSSARIASLFIELLERQYPIASIQQKIALRSAKDFADRLAIHSNHLNKVLKDNTGKTTTELISDRLIQEAKILLKQTNWNISEIAYSLGFEQLSHFSSFFKKQTSLSPIETRNQKG